MGGEEVAADGEHFIIEITLREVHPEHTLPTPHGREPKIVSRRVLTRSKLISTASTLDAAAVKAQRLLEIERQEQEG